MANRRTFLQALSSLPLLGTLSVARAARSPKRDYFRELGIKPFINAAGTYTTFTASLMLPEVTDAWEYASRQFVRLNDLHDAVGARIASLIGCEAAMVSAGAASALTLGTAGVLTGKDQEFIRRLPDISGMKTEVIIQKSHRVGYDHAVRNCGIKLVEVETREQLEGAINPQTAMLLFINFHNHDGQVKDQEFVTIAKKHGIPSMNDAAADVPPVENLSKYTKMGFDLVAFSGGKGIRGPQSCGLLLGRRDLIEAARMNASPNGDAIGRGMKVNKEELLGMMVAVESYVKRDHAEEWRDWEKRIKTIADAVSKVPGITTETHVPEIANHVPHLRIKWDTEAIKLSVKDVQRQMREGEPAIELTPADDVLTLNVWMLQDGEDRIVGKRLQEVLKSGKA